MSAMMETLLADQRRIEGKASAPAPKFGRADRIISEGHAKRIAYRQRFPDADTVMVFGAQTGYLHGEIQRLCNEADALTFKRDADLLYFEVTCDELDRDVWAGISYYPGSPERITSAAYFERTGDPGDPGAAEEIELMEVWANGVDIASVLLERVAEQILQSAVNALHAQQAKEREADCAEVFGVEP